MSVYKRLFIFFLLSTSLLMPAMGDSVLPAEVVNMLKKSRIPKSNIGIVIKRLEDNSTLVRHQASKFFNPASVVKLATSIAAMDILGPTYRWKTVIATDGHVREGVLEGNLYLVGGGDPYLTLDRFLKILFDLRYYGIQKITGELIIDDSFFNLLPFNPSAFDGASYRTYNVGANGLVVNFKSFRVIFSVLGKKVRVYTDPPNDNFIIDNQVKVKKSSRCYDWRQRIQENYLGTEQRLTLVVKGSYSTGCGEQSFYISALSHMDYIAGAFGALWKDMGGEWTGEYRRGIIPSKHKVLLEHESDSLVNILSAMNKYSNNVIARHLFLSLSAERNAKSSLHAARRVMQRWLNTYGVHNTMIDNGSGLSRFSRITPAAMEKIMEILWWHPYREEMLVSLPLWGLDGTLSKRKKKVLNNGIGRLKTGSLVDVKAISGFIRDKQGRNVLTIIFTKQVSAKRTKKFQDDIINWLYLKK